MATAAARAVAAARRPDGLIRLTQKSGRLAQVWPEFETDAWGKTVARFDPRVHRPPAADLMILLRDDDLAGCCMAEDFRRGAKKWSDGIWRHGPVLGVWPTWSLVATCARCAGEVTPLFESTLNRFYCSRGCLDADRE